MSEGRPGKAEMRKVIMEEWVTLDRVVQPGRAEEDPDGGFAYAGRHMRYCDLLRPCTYELRREDGHS